MSEHERESRKRGIRGEKKRRIKREEGTGSYDSSGENNRDHARALRMHEVQKTR